MILTIVKQTLFHRPSVAHIEEQVTHRRHPTH